MVRSLKRERRLAATSSSKKRSTARVPKSLRDSLTKLLEETPDTIMVTDAQVQTVKNEPYFDLQADLIRLEVERQGIIATIQGLKEDLNAERELRDTIGKCEEEHYYHSKRVDEARRAYETGNKTLNTLLSLAAMEESGGTNLKIHQRARLPLSKVGPNRLKPLALGTFAGLAAGIGLAVLRQLLDRRLRYPETVERSLGIKILGVVPEKRRLRSFPKSAPAA